VSCNRPKIISYGSLIVVLLLAAVATTPLLSAPVRSDDKAPGIIAKLNLTPAQREALKKYIGASRAKMTDARNDLRSARMDFFRQMRQYRVDDSKVQDTVRRIGVSQRRLLQVVLENQLGLRRILTRTQFVQLGDAIKSRRAQEKREEHGGPGMWQGFGASNVGDINRLGLTDDQKKRIGRLFDSSSTATKAAATRLQTEMRTMRGLYLSYDLDRKRVNAQMDRVADAERGFLRQTINRQVELRKILTEDQFETLAKTMRPPGPKPGDRPERHRLF
jgi:Spy/CpxP family protein refolding chaperone